MTKYKYIIRKLIVGEDGMTLMELIISILLISIIAMAAFAGLQYGYHVMMTSGYYIELAYEGQQELESNLSMVSSLGEDTVAADPIFAATPTDEYDETINFIWDTTDFLVGVDALQDFDAIGIRSEKNVTAGYLTKSINAFIPINTN